MTRRVQPAPAGDITPAQSLPHKLGGLGVGGTFFGNLCAVKRNTFRSVSMDANMELIAITERPRHVDRRPTIGRQRQLLQVEPAFSRKLQTDGPGHGSGALGGESADAGGDGFDCVVNSHLNLIFSAGRSMWPRKTSTL